eukprot:scaffold770_cov255-Pinguiococcus_pyrenoidosus.AAC.43
MLRIFSLELPGFGTAPVDECLTQSSHDGEAIGQERKSETSFRLAARQAVAGGRRFSLCSQCCSFSYHSGPVRDSSIPQPATLGRCAASETPKSTRGAVIGGRQNPSKKIAKAGINLSTNVQDAAGTAESLAFAPRIDMDPSTIGVLGGGQLGRMMAEAAHRLGLRVCVLDPLGKSSPAGTVAEFALEGSFKDEAKIAELAELCDILTVEIEHVDCEALGKLEDRGVNIQPTPAAVRLIQDKLEQKKFVESLGLPEADVTTRFVDCPTLEAAQVAGEQFGFPLMLKARRGGYDGKSNYVARTADEVPIAFSSLSAAQGCGGVYAEKWCPFEQEIAVMVVRGVDRAGEEDM